MLEPRVNELPSDSRTMPNADAYNVVIDGVRVKLQYSHDDGYYGFAFDEQTSLEVAFTGPFSSITPTLAKISQGIRRAGYWAHA